MLTHLIVHPQGGLCNRFRVIFSGLRVTERYGARLSIVFPCGDPRELIVLPDHVDALPEPPDLSDYACFTRDRKNRPFDFRSIDKAYFEGLIRFNEITLPPFNVYQYARYIKPSERVLARTNRLKRELCLPDRYISMHIRRGDHKKSMEAVPDDLVLTTVGKTLAEHPDDLLLIACEDVPFRTKLKSLYGDRIAVASRKTEHWVGGNELSMETAIDDYAELLLLSKGLFIIGSGHSSYSRMIISCNGPNRKSFLMGKNVSLNV